jgi:hypothetical protein
MTHTYTSDSYLDARLRQLEARADAASPAEAVRLRRRIARLSGFVGPTPTPAPQPRPAPARSPQDASMASVPGAFEAAPGFWEVRP